MSNEEKQTMTVLSSFYALISLFTFFVWIICGTRKNSAYHIVIGIFFSGLWPILWLYVLLMKISDPKWNFCE
jgi:hypothetical protein